LAQNSGIEWTESTCNPVTGCTKIIPGCAHCYAERPVQWKRPQMIFVNSMSDLFHKDVPFFFKQWGGANKKQAGRILAGKTWEDMPSCCADERSLVQIGRRLAT
jgi:protein gp37